jgi:uncharacterized protein
VLSSKKGSLEHEKIMSLTHRLLAAFAAVSLALSTAACVADTEQDDVEVDVEEVSQDLFGPPRFETFQGKNGRFYFRLVAGNSQIVLQSQSYARRQNAQKGADAVLRHGADEQRFEHRVARNGQFYFVVKSTNGEIIGTSETYVTKYNAERGARAVRAIVARLQREQDQAIAAAAE